MRRKVLVMIKNSLLALFTVCVITSPAEGKDGFSTEKRAQLMLQYTGGMVTNAAKGMIVIYDTQAKWDHAEISREASAFLGGFRLPYTIQRETPAQVHSMYDLLFRSGANAGVFIVNDRTLPAILTSPDSAFAVLNVASCESKGINLSTGIDNGDDRASTKVRYHPLEGSDLSSGMPSGLGPLAQIRLPKGNLG